MDYNCKERITKATAYFLCGVILIPTFTGFVCKNPSCPDYMLEKHEHIPEKGDTGVSGTLNQGSLIGTASLSASGITEIF